MLGDERALIVNQTPGPFSCDTATPSGAGCPFDGTNFERFYGGTSEISKLLPHQAGPSGTVKGE